MKKIIHGLFGDSSDEKKHQEHPHGHPEDLTGIQLNNQPIQAMGTKGSELHGVPLTYGPMHLHSHSLLPPSSLRSPPRATSPVHFDNEVHPHTPWLQLHTLDNAVELMVDHLKALDHDVDMAFNSLGLKRQREHEHDHQDQTRLHHNDQLAEGTRLQEQEHHQEFPMDWANENSRYRIKIPMGYNVNPEHIHVTMEDRILIVKYKNSLDTQTGHMEEQLIKKIPMPEAVDAKKLRVMFKPEGYLLIEGPELQGSHVQQFASAAGESVKRDYADAVSQGVKKARDDQPTVTPRLNETQRQTKSFEQETTNVTNVSHPRVSEVGSQLGKTPAPSLRTGPLEEEHKQWLLSEQSHHDQNLDFSGPNHPMEPRGPYIQETTRPGLNPLENQHVVHQSQHMVQHPNQPQLQQTRPTVQQVQTVHGRFEGPLDTSAFASIQPTGYIPGYMPEHGQHTGYDQMKHDVNRGANQMQHKAEDVKHQAGHKWEETKEKTAELKDKAGEKLHDAKESVKETLHDTKEKASELADKAGDKLHDAKEGIKEGWENTKEKVSELADKAGDKLHDAKESIKEGWEKTKDTVADVADKTGDKLEAAKDTVVDKAKAAKDKVADVLTPEEKPEHHEFRREEFHRPIQQQQPQIQREHVHIEKDFEYTRPTGQAQPHGRMETNVQHRQQQVPLNQGLHQQTSLNQGLHHQVPLNQQKVQQSIHHGHVQQPEIHRQPLQQQHGRFEQHHAQQQPQQQHGLFEQHHAQHQPQQQHGRFEQQHTQQHGRFEQHQKTQLQPQQQHGRFEQHHTSEQHRSGQQQPLKQNVNIDRQAFQAQQPMGRRRSDETHLQESHRPGLHHEEQHQLSKMERSKEHTPIPIPKSERTQQGQDVQVPLVDTAVGRRMSQEDAKNMGVEHRDWVNKPELRADHINKVGFDDIMKQSVAHSESGTGKTQVHFTPPAEGGRRERPEGVDRNQQLHRDVNRPQPEGNERRTQQQQHQGHQRYEIRKDIQRHEVHKDVHDQHEEQPSKLERGLEKVTDKVLGFFGVEVEGHHKPEDVKGQLQQKGNEIKNKAGEKIDQAKDKGEEMKHRAGQKVDQAKKKTEDVKNRAGEKMEQAGDKAQELKHRAGQKIDQTKNKAGDLKDRAGQKAHETKEQAGEAWEKTKAKTAEMKDQAGQKISDVKHTAGEKTDQAKDKAAELKNRAGDKIEQAKEKTSETWEDTKDKAAELKDKAGEKLHDAKESVKEGWETTKDKASELAGKAGEKLEAAKDTIVDTAKAAKDKVADTFTPSEKPEHQRSELHHQQPLGRTQLHQQPIQRTELHGQQLHGQRTRVETDYEYSRPLGTQGHNLQNPQMRPMETQFQHRQPVQQPGMTTTHFEKHVEKHREVPAPTGGKMQEHFEHHEILPGQPQHLQQRTNIQSNVRQQNIHRPGETVGHKLDQAKESASDTLEEGKQRGQQMVNKAGEKLHEAKEKVGQTLEDTQHKAAETWENTKEKAAELKDTAGEKLHGAKETVVDTAKAAKEKAAELTDKAGNKLHDAKESVVETLHDTKEKAAELTDKAGNKLHDAKETVKDTLHDTWEGTKDKASDLKEKAGEKLEAAKETIVEAKDTVAEKLGSAKDTVADTLTHAKDKVVDFFTPEHHEETQHVEQKRISGGRPATHLSSEAALEQRRREELHGKPVKVRLEGPVTIQGRVVGGEVLASDLTSMKGSTVSGTAATRGQVAPGTHGARSEQFKSEVKTTPQQQQQQSKIETRTTKVVHEEKKTVAPGGLLKKGTTTNQSPQAM